MSIIADTLKRLQAQSEDPTPKPKDTPLPRPAFNKGEGSGRHRKDSPFGFLIVLVGMTITLGGLAVSAFWIGGHLDFGLATNTQARVNDHHSLPGDLDLSQDPSFVDPQSKIQVVVNPETTQFSQSPTTPTNHERNQASKSLETIRTTIPNAPPHKVPTLSPLEKEASTPSTTLAMAPPTSQDEPSLSQMMAQTEGDNEESVDASLIVSEEPLPTMISPEIPTTQIHDLETEIGVSAQINQSEDTNLVAISLEEELIQTEEFTKPSNSVTDSAPKATTFEALRARREGMNDQGPTAVPLQPSPANRLRHAQQLIRSGEYDDAVALLSPLFHDPPMKWQPWFWMGTALLGKGEMEQADQFLLSGLARNDKIPQLWIQRALVAQQRGDYQLAIHELRQAESLDAALPHIHLNMGYAYERLGNDRLANQYYGKFLKLSEDKPTFFSTRKKLFARITGKTPTVKILPPSSPLP